MKNLSKSQILRFTEKAIHLARRAVSRYSSKFAKHRHTLPQHVVLLCPKVRKNTTDRSLPNELIDILRIRRVLELAEFPTEWELLINCSEVAAGLPIGFDAIRIRVLPGQHAPR
jgi:hypothetical protein